VWQFRDTTIQDEVMRMTRTRVSLLLLGVELLGLETYHISTSVSTTHRVFFHFLKEENEQNYFMQLQFGVAYGLWHYYAHFAYIYDC
jgi:hypothetical protein